MRRMLSDKQIQRYENKQDKLTAGTNITIDSDNVISASATAYTAGNNIQINDDVISATDTTYTVGTGISMSGNVISLKTYTCTLGASETSGTLTSEQITSLLAAGNLGYITRGNYVFTRVYNDNLNSVYTSAQYSGIKQVSLDLSTGEWTYT